MSVMLLKHETVGGGNLNSSNQIASIKSDAKDSGFVPIDKNMDFVLALIKQTVLARKIAVTNDDQNIELIVLNGTVVGCKDHDQEGYYWMKDSNSPDSQSKIRKLVKLVGATLKGGKLSVDRLDQKEKGLVSHALQNDVADDTPDTNVSAPPTQNPSKKRTKNTSNPISAFQNAIQDKVSFLQVLDTKGQETKTVGVAFSLNDFSRELLSSEISKWDSAVSQGLGNGSKMIVTICPKATNNAMVFAIGNDGFLISQFALNKLGVIASLWDTATHGVET